MKSKRNVYLDLFKYFLAFLVVCIHFECNTLLMPIYRVAVPTFFIISGFFAFSPDYNKQLEKCKKLIKSSIKYLVIGLSIYFIYDLISIFFCLQYGTLNTELQHLILTGTMSGEGKPLFHSYHLWFLHALIMVAIYNYFICKFNKQRIYLVLVPIFIALSLFINGYAPALQLFTLPTLITRNSILTGLPFFGIGFLIKKYNITLKSVAIKILVIVVSIAFLGVAILERYNIYEMEFYLSSVISSIGFILFFTSINVKENKFSKFFYDKVGTNGPFYCYILHIMFGMHFRTIGLPTGIVALVTFLTSVAIYEIFFIISKLCNSKLKSVSKNTSQN